MTQKWPYNDLELLLALDYDSHPLIIRLNVGQNWAQVRTGPPGDRNKYLKGFRPSRRTLQVTFKTLVFILQNSFIRL